LPLLVALPLPLVFDRYRYPGKGLLASLVLIPMILPPFVGAIGIKQIFGQYGALNALAHRRGRSPVRLDLRLVRRSASFGRHPCRGTQPLSHHLPQCRRGAGQHRSRDGEAAENLGCTGRGAIWRITLPLMKPGLFAGGTIVFIWTFTELGVPLIFDYARVTPVQIFRD